MVNLTFDSFCGLMRKQSNIRNVTVISSSSHDKSAITDALAAADGILSPDISANVGITDTRADEAESGTHLRSTDISLCYKARRDTLKLYKGKIDGNLFLVNIVDVPINDNPLAEVSADMCIADGAVVLVDSDEGVTSDTECLLRQALSERIRPILCLIVNIKCARHSQDYGEQLYQKLFSVIKKANAVAAKYEDKLLSDVHFSPDKGNVAFVCLSGGWGFTLANFAKLWSPMFKVKQSEMMERLWGECYYDKDKNEWSKQWTGAESCKRAFVFFCLDKIMRIMDYCMKDDKEKLGQELGLHMKPAEKKLSGEPLLKCVMKRWLHGENLLGMMILELPSPLNAQKYRVENLYNGPPNDYCASAVRGCNPDGPLLLYVSKMIQEKGRSLAYGRIFSGTVQAGMEVCIMGPNHVRGQEVELSVESVQGASIWMGNNLESVDNIPCGNIVALVGMDATITKNATLTNMKKIGVGPIRAISVSVLTHQRIDDVILEPVCRWKSFSLPYSVYDDLFLHQREGIFWLWSVHCKNKGGIVADDMGLGKTRQASSFLRGLFHSDIIKRAMIVTPPTVIDQWERELAKVGIVSSKFTKSKDVTALKMIAKQGGVLITSYELYCIHEASILREVVSNFDYVIADEGHIIKNDETDVSKALRRISCNHKIMLTGTPIQNNIMELHTWMSFCNPTLLGNSQCFKDTFSIPIDRGKYRNSDVELKTKSIRASKDLEKLIDPFILRRTKEATGRLKSKKFEVTVWLEISPLQIKLYEALVQDNILRSRGKALAGIQITQDICRHPLLVMPHAESSIEGATSAKLRKNLMSKLQELNVVHYSQFTSSRLNFVLYFVPKLLQDGHKILIFSQSPGMLEILQDELGKIIDEKEVIRMDGRTSRKERMRLVNEFQASLTTPLVFLMSTKVWGGLGITLTNATRVIILDPSENPSDDNQAVDRAYRIGQEDDVIVYRLVMCGTIEEHIYREQIVKVGTACAILEGRQIKRVITKQEGLVLVMPSQGFGVSRTHRQLTNVHCDDFDRSMSADLEVVKDHESTVAVTNHNLIFSLKEDLLIADYAHDMFDMDSLGVEEDLDSEGSKVKEASIQKQVTEARIKIPRHLVPFFRSKRKDNEVQRASGCCTVQIMRTNNPGFEDVYLGGYIAEIAKAEKLIHDIVKETETQMIYVKREQARISYWKAWWYC